jgi:hypothetical protein
MALTYDVIQANLKPGAQNVWEGYVDITLDDTYVQTGWPIAVTSLVSGATEILAFVPPSAVIEPGDGDQCVGLAFDSVNSKLFAYVFDGSAAGEAAFYEMTTGGLGLDNLDGGVIRCYFCVRK